MRKENLATPYRFNGKEQDCESGMHYYGARYYDSRLSRFISVDPLADDPDNIGFSPYAYVWNNPLRFTDPTGMKGEDWVQRSDGSIYWDDNATSQATTKEGETYLGEGGFSTVSSTGLQTNYNSDKTFDHYNTDENTLPEAMVTAERPIPNFGPIGDITGANQVMADMDHALDVYEAEGLMPYLYTQISIAHSENAGSMGRAIENRLGRTRSRSATGSIRTTNTRATPTPTVRVSGQNRTIHTGPKGGKYYINSNGNKTYLNRDGTKRP